MTSKLLPPPRPQTYPGSTTRYSTACGKVYVTVCVDSFGYPVEVFARMGKVGGCPSAFLEAVSRTISVALRCGIDAAEIASQYIGINCTGGAWDQGTRITSCVTAIGLELKRVMNGLSAKPEGTADDKDNLTEQALLAADDIVNDELAEATATIKEQARVREEQGLRG